MFAKVFHTARSILSRSPSVPGGTEDSEEATIPEPEPRAVADMVTTRRGTETPGTGSAAKAKGKRSLDAEETPTANKRMRRSMVGKRGQPEEAVEDEETIQDSLAAAENESSDNIGVNVPIPRTTTEESLPIRRRSSPRVLIPKASPSTSGHNTPITKEDKTEVPASTQDTVFHTPATHPPTSSFATPRTHAKVESSPTLKVEQAKASPQVSPKKADKRKKSQKNNVSDVAKNTQEASNVRDEIPSSTWESDHDPVPEAEKAHVRFGSEEPAEPAPILAKEPVRERFEPEDVDKDGEHNDSDSDAEPEVVSTAAAASKAQAKDDNILRAHKAELEKAERKKAERERRMAEEREEKRKREEKHAKKLARHEAKLAKKEEKAAPPRAASIGVGGENLPDLLPDSLLEAAGDTRPATPPRARAGKTAEALRKEQLNHHTKFLERGEQPIKDVKKGGVNVSVLAQQNKFLAPKVKKATKNIREGWLKGREVDKRRGKGGRGGLIHRKVERRAVGGGFLRNGDDD